MTSRLFYAGVLAFALAAQPVFAAAVTQEAAAPGSQQPRRHRPLPKPVNLKVLPKNIAPEELIKIMRGFAGALGVECSFCHVRNAQTHKFDFASDAKAEKETARLMIRMSKDIDQNYLAKINDPDAKPEDKRVTCGTCHRGHHMPTQFVPPPDEHHGHSAPGGEPSGQ